MRLNKLNHWIIGLRRLAPDALVRAIDTIRASPSILLSSHVPIPYSATVESSTPFFIVGCGRSGNTLLRNLLCQEYEVGVPPEIPGLGNTIRAFHRSRWNSWPTVVDLVIEEFRKNADITRNLKGQKYNLNDQLNIDYQRVAADLKSLNPPDQSLSAVILSLYQDCCNNIFGEPQGHIGDKTPWNTFHLGRIHRVFPKSRFVHMLRNPRAVAASYKSNYNGVREISVAEASRRWRDSVTKILSFSERHKDLVLSVGYEDLVRDSAGTVAKVARFLGISSRPTPLEGIRFGE